MAAAVRNNVWVAPGQDAQFLHKTTAPLTADGLRGEDHGQVLCNTRDAVPGTSSFHDYNLVGVLAFSLLHLPQSIALFTDACWFGVEKTACLLIKAENRLFSLKDVSPVQEGWACVFVSCNIRSFLSRHVTENSLWTPVLMLTFTD